MLKLPRNTNGFSFIEMIVVVAIISVLATLVIVSVQSARISARDSRRVSDINEIRSALNLYYSKYNQYPTAITPGQALTVNSVIYLESVPHNPTPYTDNGCPNKDYDYSQTSSGLSYTLSFCLGYKQDAIAAGNNLAIPEGIVSLSSPSWACGDSMSDLDGNSYSTVLIGTQCWMAQNLNTKQKPDGTCINGGASPPCADASGADAALGRSCYNNTESNCTTYGSLYTWAGMMNGETAEGAQGICPSGWHIPSDTEQDTLDQYLKDSGQTCNAARNNVADCVTAGTKLQSGGSSGFNGPLAGYRNADYSTFTGLGTYGVFRSSTGTLGIGAWYRYLYNGGTGTVRLNGSTNFGLSVRCIKS